MLQFGFIRVVTTIACRHIGKCRNVDFSRTSNGQSFHQRVKSCNRVERRHSADDTVRVLGADERQDPEFQKEYLKLVGEEPTSVVSNEMNKLIRERPRDRRAIQKNQRRMYDCKTLHFSNTQQIMPDPEAAALRVIVAIGDGWFALRLTGSLNWLFAALAFGLIVYGVTLTAAITLGACFGRERY